MVVNKLNEDFIQMDGVLYRKVVPHESGMIKYNGVQKKLEVFIAEWLGIKDLKAVSFRDMNNRNFSIDNLDFVTTEEWENPTVETLKKLYHYDPETGHFTRKFQVRGSKCGRRGDFVFSKGYRALLVGKKQILAHVCAYAYMNGEFPEHQIDHINGKRDDNRIINLREVSNRQNANNRRPKADGLPHGVKKTRTGNYAASITVNYKQYHLGTYDTIEEATEARLKGEKQFGIA